MHHRAMTYLRTEVLRPTNLRVVFYSKCDLCRTSKTIPAYQSRKVQLSDCPQRDIRARYLRN